MASIRQIYITLSTEDTLDIYKKFKKKARGLGQSYGGNQGCGYESLKIVIIEQFKIGDQETLGRREIYWQTQLRCFMENGGLAQCKRKEK